MAEVKLRCLVCGSTELESTADGYKCDRCGSVINYTSSYMNHLALFDKVASYVDKGDSKRANQVIEELLKCSRTCPETYWYQLLSDYGIRYIDDMCHVTNDIGEPITTNENYKNALKFSGYYMEKFFKQKAKFFEDIRVGAGQEPIDNVVAADKINVTLTDSLFNEIDIEQNRTIKSSSSDNANEIKSDNKKGITLDTSDYVHKGHNHCEADDNFDAENTVEAEKVHPNTVKVKKDRLDIDDTINAEKVKLDIFNSTDNINDTNENILLKIIEEKAIQKKKQNLVIGGLVAGFCVLLLFINIVIFAVMRELTVSLIFFSLVSSIVGVFLCGVLNKNGKLKIIPLITFVVSLLLIMVSSIIGLAF